MSWCPQPLRVAVLVNPANATNAEITLRDVEPAARAIGLQIQVLKAGTSHEIEAAFATLVRERPDALFVGTDPFFSSRHVQLVNLASRHAIPAIYSQREFADVGGLMSYGSSMTDALSSGRRLCRSYSQGREAGDLPVVQSTKFELVINLPDRQDARPYRAADAARPRRRGDRISAQYLLRLLTAGCGTPATSQRDPVRSGYAGKPEEKCSS